MNPEPLEYARETRGVRGAIRAAAFEMLIVGVLALFFGFSLASRAPINISDVERDRWFATQNTIYLVMKIGGAGLLVAAGLASAGLRAGLFAALAADTLLLLAFAALGMTWGALAIATSQFDVYILLALIFAIFLGRDVVQGLALIRATAPRAGGPPS